MTRRWIGWLCALLLGPTIAGHCRAQSVLVYHGSPDRSGNFIVPALNWERARLLHLDPSFHPQFPGHLYAQPLYWQPPGSASGLLIVATENDDVHAIDAKSGSQVWTRSLGRPVALSTQPCGNIDPLGITGTPVIDEATQAVYLDAMVGDASGAHHRVFALSLKDGAPLPGWPLDVAEALAARGQHFNTRFPEPARRARHSRRQGLCALWRALRRLRGLPWLGPRHQPAGPARHRQLEHPRAGRRHLGAGRDQQRRARPFRRHRQHRWRDHMERRRGGVPADARSAPRGAAAGLFRTAGLASARRARCRSRRHQSAAVRGAVGCRSKPFVLALGKDARAYLLDDNNLGGIGGSLASAVVSTRSIRTAPAAYPAVDGVFVAFQGNGANCPTSQSGGNLTVLHIRAGSPPSLDHRLVRRLSGARLADRDDDRRPCEPDRLGRRRRGRRATARLPGRHRRAAVHGGGSGNAMTGLRHFQTLLAAGDRLYIGADGRVYAFAF